jgi:hypothetical protein
MVAFDDVSTNRVIQETRLLVADGYNQFAPPDGYLNPMIEQENGQQLTISNGAITANTLKLGPFAFPYTYNNFSGGIDPIIFEPPNDGSNNIQLYIHIVGTSLSPKGNYFSIKRIMIDGMGDISYSLLLEAFPGVVA